MFYLQHGFGKGLKVAHIHAEGYLGGMVLSPAHEDRFQLRETVSQCRGLGLDLMLDPQSYIYSLTPQGTGRQHLKHGLDLTDLHWSQTADTMKRHLDVVREANQEIGIEDCWIAPSPFQATLTDFWLPIALQYARTASGEWGSERTIASLVLDENLLTAWSSIEEWLDVLTTLEVRGFYLLVNRNRPQYPPVPWVPEALANLLRLIFTLTEINGYEVIWGYSDTDGLLGSAVGATGIASGWSYGLRQFSTSRWNEKRSGGAPAVPRVHLRRLWSPVRWNEAADLFDSDAGKNAFGPRLKKRFDNTGFESLSNTLAQEQHLSVLAERVAALDAKSDAVQRLDTVADSLEDALAKFGKIAEEGIALEPRYAARVRSYREALELFRKSESL